MTFSEFAQKLYPIIGGGSSHHAFARTLIESVISDEGVAIVDEYSEDSFKSYYKGDTKVTKLAQKIMPYADPFYFSEFIKGFEDSPVESLCGAFEDDIPDIDSHNAPDKLAQRFYLILKEAASTKRSQAKLKQENIDDKANEAEDIDDEEPSGDDDGNKKRTIIHQQTNVVQNGETNISLTNNGTINFDLKGDF